MEGNADWAGVIEESCMGDIKCNQHLGEKKDDTSGKNITNKGVLEKR